jgi:hypothetical protein
MGIHTRLSDEVEPWKIKRSLQMVREMGAPWIVEYFPWAYSEPSPGRFDWAHADLVVDHARAQGLTVIARLGLVPSWARPPETSWSYLDESGYEAFANFAAVFAERFEGRVSHIIIWNEPNVSLEWGFRPPDPKAYVRMLATVYPTVRATGVQVEILVGALAPTLASADDPDVMSDLDYLSAMYEAGSQRVSDGLAVHAYGWNFGPADPPSRNRVNYRRTELLRDIMVRNGDNDRQIYVTEGGWNDHPRWTKAVTPTQRAMYTIQAYEWAQERWLWCRAVCLWALRYPRPTHTYQDYFTFVTDDFRPKPLYQMVQDYARGTDTED